MQDLLKLDYFEADFYLSYSGHILQVVPLYPEVGYVEMDPDAIFEGFITVVKGAVKGTVAPLPAATTVPSYWDVSHWTCKLEHLTN